MTSSDRDWEDQLRERFSQRMDLPLEELFAQEFSNQGADLASFLSCCEHISSEFGVPAGRLRASDELALIFQAPKARTPWRWLVFQVREGDAAGELDSQLRKRMKEAGTVDHWKAMSTFSDLVRAWSGLLPS